MNKEQIKALLDSVEITAPHSEGSLEDRVAINALWLYESVIKPAIIKAIDNAK